MPQEAARVCYVDTTTESGLALLDALTGTRDVDFFCLNDGSFPEVTEAERVRRVAAFLESWFPEPAPWERVSAPPRHPIPESAPGAA